jgi:hypothetical protein
VTYYGVLLSSSTTATQQPTTTTTDSTKQHLQLQRGVISSLQIMVKSSLLLLFSAFSFAEAFSRPRTFTGASHGRNVKGVTAIPRGGSLTPSNKPSSTTLHSVTAAVNTFYKTWPLTSAFLTCGMKASAADLVAQKGQAAKDRANKEVVTPLQKKRNLAFFMYGGLYQGMAQEIIFNEFFPVLFGHGTDVMTVLSKVLSNSFVVPPLLYLPVAYLVKSVIFQHSVKEAVSRYVTDVTKNRLLFKYWR